MNVHTGTGASRAVNLYVCMPQPLFPADVYFRVTVRSRGYLPHWELDGGTYFVTFHTADALPRQFVSALQEELRILRRASTRKDPQQFHDLRQAFEHRLDGALDRGEGTRPMGDPARAAVVARALQFFNGSRYDLLSWCVMPNHVHALLTMVPGHRLSTTVHSWKSYTAHRFDAGNFWTREYYDRLMRSENDVREIDAYIRANPGKAGLREWAWVGSKV